MSFSEWISGIFSPKEKKNTKGAGCGELTDCLIEFAVREYAIEVCSNIIENAVGRANFFHIAPGGGVVEKSKETFIWTVSPNKKQNSTEFLHEMVGKLVRFNEVLIIDGRPRKIGNETIESRLIADSWTEEEQNGDVVYKDVRVGDTTFKKTFSSADVIHLRMNCESARKTTEGMAQAYKKLISSGVTVFTAQADKKWKVHIDDVSPGSDSEQKADQKLFTDALTKFSQNGSRALIEYDGITYTDMEGNTGKTGTSRDIRAMIDDVLTMTAQSYGIPPQLALGSVQDTKEAVKRLMTGCVDPLMDQLSEEIMKKEIGFERWSNGERFVIDTSAVLHYDIFDQAAGVEKLIGSGVFSIDDVLKAVGLPEIGKPWSKAHYITKNFETFDEAMKGEGEA